MKKRVDLLSALQRAFCRRRSADGLEGRGLGRWNMASEQRTEPYTVERVRLRQDSPVIADKVIDLMRSALREADKKKW